MCEYDDSYCFLSLSFIFSILSNSPELVDFLIKILEKNPDKRLTLAQIKQHPWLAELASTATSSAATSTSSNSCSSNNSCTVASVGTEDKA